MDDVLEILRETADYSLRGTKLTWEKENGFVFANDPDGVTLFVTPEDTVRSGFGFAIENGPQSAIAALTETLLRDVERGEKNFQSWESLAPLVLPATRSLTAITEMDEETAIRKHVAGDVFVVLAANLPNQICVLPEATLRKVGATPAAAWKAAKENLRRWFLRRLYLIEEQEAQISPGRTVKTLMLTDDDLVSSALIDAPVLIGQLASVNGLLGYTAFTVPYEGFVIIGQSDRPAIDAIKYHAGRLRRHMETDPSMSGMKELTRDVFIIGQDGSLRLAETLQ
jgi:hypothetical protein